MVRLVDSGAGELVQIGLSRGGLLRVCVHPHPGGQGGLTDLRALLIADVLTRVIELNDVQVLVALAIPDSWPGRVDDLAQPARALGIHPPAVTRGEGEVRAALGGSVDVHIAGAGADVEGLGGVRVEVGEAAAVPNRLAGDRDPLALRLALLTRRHYYGAEFNPGILDEADATLHRWRDGVAVWARAPSRPMPPDVVREAYAAFENNLDTPSVLRHLDRLAGDVDVADGAKFETFVHLDRVLAVDLARDIGAGPG